MTELIKEQKEESSIKLLSTYLSIPYVKRIKFEKVKKEDFHGKMKEVLYIIVYGIHNDIVLKTKIQEDV
ncbi:MAG: hypothetical protein LBC06_01655 [Rickettsiales bacterium]|jgi:hypothetical protein|nr:hypothetical protein [Rickettsiales bacterium]